MILDEKGHKYLSCILKVLKTFPLSSSWLSPFSLWNAAIVPLSDGRTLQIDNFLTIPISQEISYVCFLGINFNREFEKKGKFCHPGCSLVQPNGKSGTVYSVTIYRFQEIKQVTLYLERPVFTL